MIVGSEYESTHMLMEACKMELKQCQKSAQS